MVPPKIVVDAERLVGAGRLEEVARLQVLVVVELERAAVDVVGARLRDHRDRRAARHALLGIERVGRDVHRFDRFRRRHIADVVRQPDVDVCAPSSRVLLVCAFAPLMWVCSACRACP